MEVSQLNAEFVIKYNRLFTEVAKHYGVEQNIFFWMNVLATIDITKLGYKTSQLVAIPYSSVLNYIDKNYPLLLPFYNFFYDIRRPNSTVSSRFDLVEINNSIKKVRLLKKEVKK